MGCFIKKQLLLKTLAAAATCALTFNEHLVATGSVKTDCMNRHLCMALRLLGSTTAVQSQSVNFILRLQCHKIF